MTNVQLSFYRLAFPTSSNLQVRPKLLKKKSVPCDILLTKNPTCAAPGSELLRVFVKRSQGPTARVRVPSTFRSWWETAVYKRGHGRHCKTCPVVRWPRFGGCQELSVFVGWRRLQRNASAELGKDIGWGHCSIWDDAKEGEVLDVLGSWNDWGGEGSGIGGVWRIGGGEDVILEVIKLRKLGRWEKRQTNVWWNVVICLMRRRRNCDGGSLVEYLLRCDQK